MSDWNAALVETGEGKSLDDTMMKCLKCNWHGKGVFARRTFKTETTYYDCPTCGRRLSVVGKKRA